jgi:hypothetical protein
MIDLFQENNNISELVKILIQKIKILKNKFMREQNLIKASKYKDIIIETVNFLDENIDDAEYNSDSDTESEYNFDNINEQKDKDLFNSKINNIMYKFDKNCFIKIEKHI